MLLLLLSLSLLLLLLLVPTLSKLEHSSVPRGEWTLYEFNDILVRVLVL